MAGTSPAMTVRKNTRRTALDASTHTSIDETSIRYDGWRIVVVCFLLATFGWAFGFYGQSVYVAELQRLHGWPASLISAGTTFFRDIRHLLEVALSVLFWTTPIVYELRRIPEAFQLPILLSPMSSFITAYRDICYYREWPGPLVVGFPRVQVQVEEGRLVDELAGR